MPVIPNLSINNGLKQYRLVPITDHRVFLKPKGYFLENIIELFRTILYAKSQQKI